MGRGKSEAEAYSAREGVSLGIILYRDIFGDRALIRFKHNGSGPYRLQKKLEN